ncbi:plasmid mobilization relaxosome protein MobC [Polaribacter ponticola]|uniref:Plasmid mobilization relaxosome protein MobC n=1 Tax=Polaribacter ponticola TaxID=2978475 RepID=A0ABT5SBH4_9FLAO|nr:plasmid mobilization relaxosome protein MobC [Polaribacter sp. MSW5]MDD7915475.1 plasmid mobilization relaxosome protein MobC [Polaribacter sp. MSW5]
MLEKLGKPTLQVKVRNLETEQYKSQLIKIGVNLNQIAKKLNSGAKFMIADQKKVLDDIDILKRHIIDINSKI